MKMATVEAACPCGGSFKAEGKSMKAKKGYRKQKPDSPRIGKMIKSKEYSPPRKNVQNT